MAGRKRNSEDSTRTRTAILDATGTIMCEEGYAAVSSRRVAKAAGLRSQLVYYHFGAMDDLFLALYQRSEEAFFQAHARALAARNPLRALWKLNSEARGAALAMEFIALANHRKVIRKEIARSTERYRRLQTAVFTRFLEERGVAAEAMSPEVLSFLMVSLSRGLVTETAIGIDLAHDAVRQAVEAWLEKLEPQDPPAEGEPSPS